MNGSQAEAVTTSAPEPKATTWVASVKSISDGGWLLLVWWLLGVGDKTGVGVVSAVVDWFDIE